MGTVGGSANANCERGNEDAKASTEVLARLHRREAALLNYID
jgi:hypothetical protein